MKAGTALVKVTIHGDNMAEGVEPVDIDFICRAEIDKDGNADIEALMLGDCDYLCHVTVESEFYIQDAIGDFLESEHIAEMERDNTPNPFGSWVK